MYILRHLKKLLCIALAVTAICILAAMPVYAADMWDLARSLIQETYNKILGLSTLLAGLMSAVAVVGAKLAGSQQKSDQSWDWLKRIWIAWAIINGLGGFVTFLQPYFEGFQTLP